MAGYYPATYGFENEVIGTSHADIDFVDWTEEISTDVEINEELDGHKNYLQLTHNLAEWAAVNNDFAIQNTGTIEFWIRINNSESLNLIRMNEDGGYVFVIEINFGEFFYTNPSNDRINILPCSSNVWYHLRFDFYSDSRFDLYIDSNLIVDKQYGRTNFTVGINSLYFAAISDLSLSALYIDAIGYSWDPNYTIGDNLEEGLFISYTNITELFWIGYSIDSLPYIYPGKLGNFTIPLPEDGVHTILIYGNTTFGVIYSDLRSFTVFLGGPPTITGPGDFSFYHGFTGYSILWSVTGDFPADFTVYSNGSVYDSGSWISSVIISLDGLSEGINIFVCEVNNTFGFTSSDEVRVTVLSAAPDETPPTISAPTDISFENGSIGYSIIWSASDDQAPWWASVRKDSTLIYDQAWIGNDIEISLDGLTIGYYVYNCTVYDKSWNYQSSFVTVNVTEAVPDFQPPELVVEPTPLEYAEGSVDNFLTWQITEDHPYAYRILVNNSEQVFNPWHGENITFNVDGFAIGKWYVNLTVWDLSGYEIFSVIVVTVIPPLPDLTFPVVSQPVELIVAENMTGILIWEVSDENPDIYVLSRNGSLIIEGENWMSGIIQYRFISLPIGTWEFTLTVYDQAGNSVAVSVNVIVLPSNVYDFQSPQINQIPNIEITYGTSGNSLIFYLFDQHPSDYSITINDTLILDNIWDTPNIKVEISLDSFAIGFYVIILYADDIYGNYASREVFVTVLGDIAPPFISSPSDIVTTRGISDYAIWIAADDNPSHFELLLISDGSILEIIETGNWTGSSISLFLGSLEIGTHNIRCVVYDTSGNFAYDEVIITVKKDTIAPGFELGTTLLLLSILVFSNKKRRNRND